MHWYETYFDGTQRTRCVCDICGEEIAESDVRFDEMDRELCRECYEETHGDE